MPACCPRSRSSGSHFSGPGEGIGAFEVLCIAIAVLIVVVASILGSAARGVFSVALLRYATGAGELGPFSRDDLEGAVRAR